jgi:hypothetical protein
MRRDLVNITDLRSKYPNKNEKEFKSLDEYLTVAIKTIKRFANKLQHGLAKQILSDEDALSNIAYKIMLGDWKWHPDYRSKSGKVRTRRAYLNQCAIWAIKEYIRRQITSQKVVPVSIDELKHEINWECKTNECHPLEQLIKDEEEVENYFKLDNVIANSGLEPLEEACLRQYNEIADFKEVGQSLGISGKKAKVIYEEAVAKVINRNV